MNSNEWIKSLNFRITFIKNKITDLEDEYQHYTMVDKDKVKEILLKEEIDLYKQIKQDLEILEIFKDNVMIDEDEKVVTLFSKNKEVVNKIKEWLYE